MRRIGILEDDESLGRELQYFLESNGMIQDGFCLRNTQEKR